MDVLEKVDESKFIIHLWVYLINEFKTPVLHCMSTFSKHLLCREGYCYDNLVLRDVCGIGAQHPTVRCQSESVLATAFGYKLCKE